jgi:uncharacterized protein
MSLPLDQQSHRPFPPPASPWVMAQTWNDLLFMHWPLKPEVLRPFIPPRLHLDTFDGEAWIAVVPFHMTGIRARMLPEIPFTSAFPELNVRTYITIGGKPGVWFFSLDAAHALAVWTARWLFHLNYLNARMSVETQGSNILYQSDRTHRGANPARFHAAYHPVSDVFQTQPGTLEHWLTERYCLYAADQQGNLYRGNIHHLPWPLQLAEAQVDVNTMAQSHAIELPKTKPLLHFAKKLDVVAWLVEQVR